MAKGVKASATYDASIFINCPFDDKYKPLFHALIFAAFDCGYVPRCAQEVDDGGQVRLEKIVGIVRSCRLGVHDISCTELDGTNGLPRFNMPFELGLFVGAARFGANEQRHKVCLILDREKHRYQKFLSDIAGQDIKAHNDEPELAIKALREYLSPLTKPSAHHAVPGGTAIVKRYKLFQAELPDILAALEWEPSEVTFADYTNIVEGWLADHPRPVK